MAALAMPPCPYGLIGSVAIGVDQQSRAHGMALRFGKLEHALVAAKRPPERPPRRRQSPTSSSFCTAWSAVWCAWKS
jgi:hypothetical protein